MFVSLTFLQEHQLCFSFWNDGGRIRKHKESYRKLNYISNKTKINLFGVLNKKITVEIPRKYADNNNLAFALSVTPSQLWTKLLLGFEKLWKCGIFDG